jgi:hypothetical protein
MSAPVAGVVGTTKMMPVDAAHVSVKGCNHPNMQKKSIHIRVIDFKNAIDRKHAMG